MKKLLLLLLVLLFMTENNPVFAAVSIDVKSTPVRATLFPEGAQVVRSATANVPAGRSILKFLDMSSNTDLSTVRVKSNGKAMVMSVKNIIETRGAAQIKAEIAAAEKKIQELQPRAIVNKLALDVVAGKLESLHSNRGVGSQGFSTVAGQNAYDYFSNKFAALKAEQNRYILQNDEIIEQRGRLISFRDSLALIRLPRTPCIVVELEAKTACTMKFEIEYLVNNVSWRPIYDMRAENLATPMNLLMKAEIQQNSGEDWRNINLKLSTAFPSENGHAPQLRTYKLDYGTYPPVYDTDRKANTNSKVTGKVLDNFNQPLPGAVVNIIGTNITTATAADGRFSLVLPGNNKTVELECRYQGMRNDVKSSVRAGDNIIIHMSEDELQADEVQVTAYGARSKSLSGSVAYSSIRMSAPVKSSTPVYRESMINTADIEKSVAKEIEITGLTTLLTSPAATSINIKQFELPVTYTYVTVPRVENSAYLQAELYGLNNLGLLDGQVNMFFENTPVGSALIESQHLLDTMSLPISREQNIAVSRKLSKIIPYSQILAGKLVQTRQWIYTICNNRSTPITVQLQDQIPVTSNNEITIDVNASEGAEIDANTGFITWTLNLAPGATVNPSITYVVKSPKTKSVAID